MSFDRQPVEVPTFCDQGLHKLLYIFVSLVYLLQQIK